MSDRDRHHLSLVLRMQPGEEVVAVEPDGAVWALRLFAVSPDVVIAGRIERLPATTELRVVLVQGVGKSDKTSEVVQGAVEVGVSAVWPVITARSIVKLDAEKRADRGMRWRRVAEAAAKQSQRTFVPEVSDPVELRHVLGLIAGCDVALVAWEDAAGAPGVREALAAAGAREGSRVALVVGPEGGLTAEEVAELETAGAIPVSLGTTILRTETAGVVGAALVVHELGGLGNRER
jgi:16S rRNA (uracil1498-N3)-methyltransferase